MVMYGKLKEYYELWLNELYIQSSILFYAFWFLVTMMTIVFLNYDKSLQPFYTELRQLWLSLWNLSHILHNVTLTSTVSCQLDLQV